MDKIMQGHVYELVVGGEPYICFAARVDGGLQLFGLERMNRFTSKIVGEGAVLSDVVITRFRLIRTWSSLDSFYEWRIKNGQPCV